jgi:hypothetical protein
MLTITPVTLNLVPLVVDGWGRERGAVGEAILMFFLSLETFPPSLSQPPSRPMIISHSLGVLAVIDDQHAAVAVGGGVQLHEVDRRHLQVGGAVCKARLAGAAGLTPA